MKRPSQALTLKSIRSILLDKSHLGMLSRLYSHRKVKSKYHPMVSSPTVKIRMLSQPVLRKRVARLAKVDDAGLNKLKTIDSAPFRVEHPLLADTPLKTDSTSPKTIEGYISKFPLEVQDILQKIRGIVKLASPGAVKENREKAENKSSK